MRHFLPTRQPSLWFTGLILAALWIPCGPQPGHGAPPPDPVEELRAVLLLRFGDILNPTPTVLEFREKSLQQKIDLLKTVSDLRRALALTQWYEDVDDVIDKKNKIRAIDAEMRKEVGMRLTDQLRRLVAQGDGNARLAVADLIAEMGPTVRALDKKDRSGFARSLTPEVIQLIDDPDLGVRQQALRALGNINAKPTVAAPVFKKVLEKDAVGPKRLAAEGLGQMMKVVSFLRKKSQKAAVGVEAYPPDVVETAIEVVKAIKPGLNDADPQVRAGCLMVLQYAGQALAELIPVENFTRKDFPPEGRDLSADERKEIAKLHDQLQKEIKDLGPLNLELRRQETLLAAALIDPDTRVRRSGIGALEAVANARLLLRRRVLSVPVVDKDTKTLDMLTEADSLQLFLTKNLGDVTRLVGDSDFVTRKSAINFLENLEEVAAPALPALTKALTDPDRFIRWSATRAIGVIGTDKAVIAVPNLAKLLNDEDLNVRMAASATLEAMSDLAKGAVPLLARAVSDGDVESRRAALYALQRISPEFAKAALPQITQALSHPDVRLRREAAVTLGKLGSVALPSVPALREALGDEDQEVRVNAGDAMLSILPLPPRKL